jgi:COMPASS component SWD3
MYLGADGAVKVWDTRSGKLIHTFEGHLAGISTISWSPDGATIASGSDDKTIRLWNVLTVVPCVYVCGLTKLMSFFH